MELTVYYSVKTNICLTKCSVNAKDPFAFLWLLISIGSNNSNNNNIAIVLLAYVWRIPCTSQNALTDLVSFHPCFSTSISCI